MVTIYDIIYFVVQLIIRDLLIKDNNNNRLLITT